MKKIKIVLVLVSFVAISILISSCENTVTNNGTPTPPDNFQLNAFDYSDSHYFVDTLYKRSFTEFYNDSITSYTQENAIDVLSNYFEVWVQCNVTDTNKRICVGKVMLGVRPPQGYDTSITNPETIIGDKFSGYFRKLYNSEYNAHPDAGFIHLKINVPEDYYVGVVYKTQSNIFGKGSYESSANDTLILKLVKIDYPSPETTPVAWNLKMKNIYNIPYTDLQNTTTIKTMFNDNNVLRDTITGYNTPLITMLKLDKFNNSTLLPPPDGKFDWLTGKTIIPATGELIFPILEPFSKGIAAYGLDSTYIYKEMYSQKKVNAQQSPKANLYVIKGNAVY
jgi:predicted small secreted protein